MVHFLPSVIQDSGFGIQFTYLVFTVFPDLKDFQDTQEYNRTETNTKRKNLPQPIIVSTDKALNYPKC